MEKSENPWKTLIEKQIYDNPWISVEEHEVLNPAGNPGIYGIVHFKNKALGIIPIDQDKNIWLVGQYRYPLNEYSWEIPMGGGPLDEDIMSSAKRELREETGISANRWSELLRIHTSNSVTDEEGFVFLAEDLTYGESEFDDTEQLEIRKLSLAEAVDMVMNGKITDSLSIAGILKLHITNSVSQ